MDNQHQKIKGYRNLTEGEIALMNKIKEHGLVTEALVTAVRDHIGEQNRAARASNATHPTEGPSYTDAQIAEQQRLDYANPGRWASIAQTDFQTALMALTRAVAQQSTF